MDPEAPQGTQGRGMMEDMLRVYLWWKARLSERKQENKNGADGPANRRTTSDKRGNTPIVNGTGVEGVLSEALKKKDREREAKAANRRRVRGGASVAAPSTRDTQSRAALTPGETQSKDESDTIAEL